MAIDRTARQSNHNVDSRWRTGHDGRTRFHGQHRRGALESHVLDDADLAQAVSTLAQARADLLAAHELPVVDRQGRIVRREAINDAVSRIALATRFADAVVIRRGGVCGDCDLQSP